MKKTIDDFLPKAAGDTRKVQGSVPIELHAEVKKIMASDPRKPTFDDLIIAGLQLYVAQRSKNTKEK